MHYVIIIPGLGDNAKLTEIGVQHWKKQGFSPIVHSVGWRDDEKDFQIKLSRILNLIDSFSTTENKISLVGCSAGGSAVINAFALRKNQIHKVVTVCSRLKIGPVSGIRSFKAKTASSIAFVQSVVLSQKNIENLTSQDKRKILTISAKYGDQLVPHDTSVIDGATNYDQQTIEHLLSISLSLTFFSNKILSFLK